MVSGQPTLFLIVGLLCSCATGPIFLRCVGCQVPRRVQLRDRAIDSIVWDNPSAEALLACPWPADCVQRHYSPLAGALLISASLGFFQGAERELFKSILLVDLDDLYIFKLPWWNFRPDGCACEAPARGAAFFGFLGLALFADRRETILVVLSCLTRPMVWTIP